MVATTNLNKKIHLIYIIIYIYYVNIYILDICIDYRLYKSYFIFAIYKIIYL